MQNREIREPVILENERQKIFGVLHLPSSIAPVPAILFCHGFGGNKLGQNRLYVRLSEYLITHGIAVLRIDFRGCGDSESDLSEMTIESEVSDALLGLKFLESHKQIDSKRMGILGVSLGGAISVLAAERYQAVKSLGLWAAVASGKLWHQDWSKQELPPPITSNQLIYDGKVVNPAFLSQFLNMNLESSLKQLSHLPLLHIHGEKDERVSQNHENCFKKWRQNLSAQSHFVKLPHSDHRFTQLEDHERLFHETATWFCNTL